MPGLPSVFPYSDGETTHRACPACGSLNIRLSQPTAQEKRAAGPPPGNERIPKDPFQRALQALKFLDEEQLQELRLVISKLIEALQDEREKEQSATYDQKNDGAKGGTDGKSRGHLELKVTNGCGPYMYLCWWDGGRHRSFYLGKAPKPEG